MSRPLLLDLFCGAGGAAMGYHRAGFDVVGVDIEPQPHYPFPFLQLDALAYVENDVLREPYSVIHASPPCQPYMRSGMVRKDRVRQLVDVTRDMLRQTGLPWVIENIPGAPMRVDLLLCGSMFGLGVRRHRWFESNMPIGPWTPACDHSRPITGVYGHPHGVGGAWRNGNKPMLPSDVDTWAQEMGIDWMTSTELGQAIPPAYTQFIGERLLGVLEGAA